MKRAIRACEAAGLRHEFKGHNHPRIVCPKTGKYITYSSSPSDVHAPRQMLREVRRYLGYDVKFK
jgi:hypothetical protein